VLNLLLNLNPILENANAGNPYEQSSLPITLTTNEATFKNIDCSLDQSCSLKTATFQDIQYKIWIIDRFHYGTKLIARYETDSIDSLTDYAFVSFIKGCSYQQNAKNIEWPRVMESFDKYLRTFFPNWIIDSIDSDPVYNSLRDYKDQRHYGYRWNEIPKSSEKSTEHFYGIDKPKFPELYVKDMPSQVFQSDSGGHLINSYDFKMCLFKTETIPTAGTREMDLGKAIYCHDWSSRFEYSATKNQYEIADYVSPVCQTN